MAKLKWVTSPGILNNLLIGIATTVQVEAVDPNNTGPITYQLISGALPVGMTLFPDGTISGTPTYSSPSNNYFTTLSYKFIIRARAYDGSVLDGGFVIDITNTVNGDFTWATPAGPLGTVPNGEFYSFRLLAESVNFSTITYSIISGELPPGLGITNSDILFDEIYNLDEDVALGNKLSFNKVVGIPIGAKISGTNIAEGTIVTELDYVKKTVTLSQNILGSIRFGAGIRFYKTLFYAGTLIGVPTFLNPVVVDQSQTFKFTVRATNSIGHINDRSFSISVTNVYGPVIQPTVEFLGTFFDGRYYSKQLNVIEINPNVKLEWKVISGALPGGLSLGQDGKISGFIQPLELIGQYGPAGYDGDTELDGIVTDKQDYNEGPYDFNQLNQSLHYKFVVQVYDGANYDLQRYDIKIISRGGWTADSENMVNDTYLTIDSSNTYIPVLLNASTTLPAARQDSEYAFKFQGYDFQNDTITYSIANVADTFDSDVFDPLDEIPNNNGLPGSFDAFDPNQSGTNNLPGVLLDATSGWLYGHVSSQVEALELYTFGVVVSKTVGSITYSSTPVFFTFPVLGDVNDVIRWNTSSNLGSIDNGAVSELSVSATSLVGKQLIYSLVDQANLPINLPQGITLLSDGSISGRASFEAFTIDNYTTTFDNKSTSIDRTYTFTVKAETVDGAASIIRQFTLTLNIINSAPYENLYLVAMPKHDQRQLYNSIIADTDIFDPAIIYRPNDPWFGVRKKLEMLFVSGLTTETLNTYQEAIVHNHWTKRYSFDGIKTAVVLDENYNIKYEVVYVSIIDPAENSNNKGAAIELELGTTISNPWIDENGVEYTTVYPNSSENMLKRLEDGIGYQDQSSLPSWMTSNQPDTTSVNKFKTPLGYTKAAVLAYTVPGAGKLVAYRLKNAGLNFNSVEFSVDRYLVDNYYSRFYDSAEKKYLPGQVTTFDYLPIKNVGKIVARVDFAVTVPFTEINGKPRSYILANGGIDGSNDFRAGTTLVFYKQEQFKNVDLYDGWVSYTSSWLGDNILTPAIEGYDSGSYDTYSLIPGYLEKVQGTAPVNQRGGVWTIDIVNDIIFLIPTFEVSSNDRVQILNGKTFLGSILYYDPILKYGQSVPTYRTYSSAGVAVSNPTTFNNGTTRFISNRDHYYKPNTQDKYLKFPQTGVFK